MRTPGNTGTWHIDDPHEKPMTNKILQQQVRRELYRNIKPWVPRVSRWQRLRKSPWFQASVSVVFAAVILVLVLSMFGCTPSEAPMRDHDVRPDPTVRQYHVGTYAYVLEFHLEDGTRCAVLYRESITCDWGGK